MIRGAQMLIAMKVISLAFDMDFGILQTIPNGFEFLGYVLSVGNSVFGPWVSYKDYLLIYYKSQWVIFFLILNNSCNYFYTFFLKIILLLLGFILVLEDYIKSFFGNVVFNNF